MGDQIVAAKINIDPELIPGARNAVRVCLQLKPSERVTIITDQATADIAVALRSEVEQIGSECSLFTLEHHARRPLRFMPEIILEDLATSQVSIFAAQSQPGELAARREMTAVVDHHGIRHGHMVNISPQIMREGMHADFKAVDALSQRLIERARHAERITCRTPHGTEFEGEFSPKLKWLKTSGIITPENWGNLPGVHIAFGHPYAEHTGADWFSKTHIDCVGRDFDIWFDDEPVMRAGKFLV